MSTPLTPRLVCDYCGFEGSYESTRMEIDEHVFLVIFCGNPVCRRPALMQLITKKTTDPLPEVR